MSRKLSALAIVGSELLTTVQLGGERLQSAYSKPATKVVMPIRTLYAEKSTCSPIDPTEAISPRGADKYSPPAEDHS